MKNIFVNEGENNKFMTSCVKIDNHYGSLKCDIVDTPLIKI